ERDPVTPSVTDGEVVVEGPVVDFTLAVDPDAATVAAGEVATVTATVTATLEAGITEDVTLTAAGVPAGINVAFAPAVDKPDFTSTMTVAAAADATLGEHEITITGTSVGGVAKTVPFTLTVVEEALPQAIALTPDRGGPGTEVTVEGEGFPVETLGIVFAIEAGGFGGEWLVSFGGIEGLALLPASVITPIPFDTDEHGKFTVTATILPNAPPGEVTFVANVAGVVATAPFTVFDPTIALTPTSGCGGTEVTITGEWFEPRLLGYVSAKNDSTGEDVIHPVPFRSDDHGSFEVQATILPDAPLGPATFAAMEAEEVIVAASFEVTDLIPPTVGITSTASDPTNVSPIPMTATFSEDVTGFELDDIAVGNGTAGNFTAVSGREYTFDVTPDADGLVTVDIAAGVATDAAGNPNEAAPQFSITYDTTPPDDGWPPELRIAGSTTVKKIADETAGVFEGNWPNTTMNVTGGGSSHGISQIKAGNVGIGMSSRELTEAEKQGLHVYTIARDAVCIVVRDSAAMAFIDDITRDQLEQIYEAGANITAMKWSDLNPAWPEELIVPRARIVGSGTGDKFHEVCNITHADEEATITATGLLRLDGDQDVVDAIKDNDYQIGYVGLGFIDQPGIRVLKVEGVMPSVATVQDGTYPMSRDLYMLTLAEGAESNARADDFINYMFTAAGQAHVAAAGFVSVPIPDDPPIRDYDVNKDNEVSVADVMPIMGHWDETSGHHGWIRADVNKMEKSV
ncbi:substrate-binding domain-containing protein, partial [Dehalococcoidia bacterium]|nr:substrate-binding domain-containing protein [Dehalococcoidia bacterium]